MQLVTPAICHKSWNQLFKKQKVSMWTDFWAWLRLHTSRTPKCEGKSERVCNLLLQQEGFSVVQWPLETYLQLNKQGKKVTSVILKVLKYNELYICKTSLF